VFKVLEGKIVNLRIMEKEDIPLLQEWLNNLEFMGEFLRPNQMSRAEIEKMLGESPFAGKIFIVEKKDGSKIGYVAHFKSYLGGGELVEIGYAMTPSERSKGYCTEAAKLLVDYLFLSMEVNRIQATTSIRNKGSQRVMEKAGLTREGTIRNFARGARRDFYLYSILREEWKEPKVLTKTT
jgi:ribosomal-protein-alanine N-acetyltransferase